VNLSLRRAGCSPWYRAMIPPAAKMATGM
jgi:hypothetical protein